MAAGGALLLLGGVVSLAPWSEALQWRNSPEALRAQRNADAPTPIWITPASLDTPARQVPGRTTAPPVAHANAPTPPMPAAARGDEGPASTVPASSEAAVPIAAAPTLEPSQLELQYTDFRFLEPPEPGAAARLTLSVHNPTGEPSGPISLALPLNWLAGYVIDATQALPSDTVATRDKTADGALKLTFDGPAAQADVLLTVDFKATDEVIDAPSVRVVDAAGREVGNAKPPTQAPPARPGPVYGIAIPRLNLKTGVTQVDWEPPLFVVGQLRHSAYVTEGNSVLVGHVRGAAGYNVFDRLDQLAVGDHVVATSRGQTYDFVVDKTEVLPEDDTSPTDPTSTPRLTLMTCAGDWNPITRDYSDRLWVIAEPADLAARTTAEAVSQPTASPLLPGQISPRGGLGNTDADLASAFGSPGGESAGKLAVYPPRGQRLEQRAQLVDAPSATSRRAVMVAAIAPPDAPLSFDAAVRLSRGLLPKDAQPRAAGPEGHQRYFVERFTSTALGAALPAEWFAARHGARGDFIVVYARRPDGHIAYVALGIGDDAQAVSALLDDASDQSP